jgi:hypothetical protein
MELSELEYENEVFSRVRYFLTNSPSFDPHPETDAEQHIEFLAVGLVGSSPSTFLEVVFREELSGVTYGYRCQLLAKGSNLGTEAHASLIVGDIYDRIEAPPGLPGGRGGPEPVWLRPG